MDKGEAREIRATWFKAYRDEPYVALAARIMSTPVTEEITRGGTVYQLELCCFWDSKPGGDIRVTGTIDDGGVSALKPLVNDFIKRSDGTVVG